METLTLQAQRGDRPLVLAVDDEVGIRDLLSRALPVFGYEALMAADAETAVQLLSREPHVAVVDVHLTGANGLWLADKIRTLSPTTAIIFATGDQEVPPTETLRPNVIAYLVKPFSSQKLKAALEEAVRWSEMRRM